VCAEQAEASRGFDVGEFLAHEREEVDPADHVVEVAKLDHPPFQVGREARADSPPGGVCTVHGGLWDSAFVTLVADAAKLAEEVLGAGLERRRQHVRAVAGRAEELRPSVPAGERALLVAAAWLHDIGYSPAVARTGFHPLDGARYLRDNGWPKRLVNLVAHHSGARFEAAERGMSTELADFDLEDSA
jgi:HD domain